MAPFPSLLHLCTALVFLVGIVVPSRVYWYAQPLLASLGLSLAAPLLLATGVLFLRPRLFDRPENAAVSPAATDSAESMGLLAPTNDDHADDVEKDPEAAAGAPATAAAAATARAAVVSGESEAPNSSSPAAVSSSASSASSSSCCSWRCFGRVLCFLLVLVLVYLATAFLLLHYRGLWCAYPLAVQMEQCATLAALSSMLHTNGVKHWMARGDLIALHRDGDVMRWEHDLDVCILQEHMPRTRELLLPGGADWAEHRYVHTATEADHSNSSASSLSPPPQPSSVSFSVYAESRVHPGSKVMYIPVASLQASNPSYGMNSRHDVFALRDVEPIVLDLFPCADSFGSAGRKFEVQWRPYCLRGYPLPFPEQDVLEDMIDTLYPNWRTRSFEHHSEMCGMWIDDF